MPSPFTIALTGAPCSGKTTLAAALAARGAHVVPEAAIDVIDALVAELGSADAQRAWRRAHPSGFQLRVARLQRDREAAARERDGLVVLDRTSIDGLAYLRLRGLEVPEEIDAIARAARPDLVVQLDLLEHAFDGRRETGRGSTLEDARAIDAALERTYAGLGLPPVRLAATLSVDERADAVLALVRGRRSSDGPRPGTDRRLGDGRGRGGRQNPRPSRRPETP